MQALETPGTEGAPSVLKGVVDDTGADRGFLLSESGFQTGAVTAARLANITLTNLTIFERMPRLTSLTCDGRPSTTESRVRSRRSTPSSS